VTAAALTLAAAFAGAPPAAADIGPGAVVFTPHRAIYDLSLSRAATGSGVADVNGRIVYEITGSACEGYTQNMRFVSRTSNQEGNAQETDLRTSSWEDVPARKLRFSTSSYQNGALAEQTRGTASRAEPGQAGKAELAKPEARTIEIPAGVYFPIQHSMALIVAAREGRHVLSADLYDGSDNGTKLFATSAIVGRQAVAGAVKFPAKLAGTAALAESPSWPVSISYFEYGARRKDEIPLYEMSYRFHENGVTSALVIDYGDYAVKGDLAALELLEPSKCAPARQ
jgi:hypothetical protein